MSNQIEVRDLCTKFPLLKMSVHILLFGVFAFLLLAPVWARAQLDLPPLNTPTPQPEIYYNGYTPTSTTPAQKQGDLDRNARYGPPYYNDGGGEDGVDDYRVSKDF